MEKDSILQNRLGAFIRAHREKTQPPSHSAQRRRTPGLRREELADLVGVSTTWITWLEQGRNVSASPATLGKLAIALNLNAAERAALFDLAQKHDPDQIRTSPSTLHTQLSSLPNHVDLPAYILDLHWNACSWNTQASHIFQGWLDKNAPSRNVFDFVFLNEYAKTLIIDWKHRAKRLVAELQADFHRRPFDQTLQAMVNHLNQHSAYFQECWQSHNVLVRESGIRQFNLNNQAHSYLQTTLIMEHGYKFVCLFLANAESENPK